jgi:NAD-dependent aldehyde dehydrogenases
MQTNDFDEFRERTLKKLGIEETNSGIFAGKWLPRSGKNIYTSISPVDGKVNASVWLADRGQYEEAVNQSINAFEEWRSIPAPRRGEIIKALGDVLAKNKKDLGALVTLEAGKTTSEGEGEIQEMIDVAYFASGLSRQLYGFTMASERPDHRLYEQWLPLGPIAVISAFNFPSSVWSWNAMVAAVCGDTVVWKPSTKASLAAVGVMKIMTEELERLGAPQIFSLVASRGSEGGEWISNDRRIPLVSFTGSTATGQKIYENVARRIGRPILELGGNNCSIVSSRADMNLALKGVAFGALATAGQRCTSTRRVVVPR